MTFNITQVPITSKLMLLQGGCKNFRSIGDEMVVNYAEHKSTLCIAESNGSGKSTLLEHLPLYALTGKTSSKEDKVDALVNTTVGKNMVCWLIWHFAGTYYKVVRGRKPNIHEIYSLVNNEWVEIPNLPVSNRDRQHFMYSLLGLDHKTASNVLENTILLSGQRFKGFSSLSTPERRDLIEPILDLSIFSALNAETKALRGEVIVAQKQTYLEVTDAKLQVALVEQDVEHKRQTIQNNIKAYEDRKSELEAELTKAQDSLKEALALDTDGGELHVQFEEESESLAKELLVLEDQLNTDLASLGEFVVDEQDKVLTKLRSDLYVIDQTIEMTKEDLDTKRKGVSVEITKVKDTVKSNLERLESDYNMSLNKLQEDYDKELEEANIKLNSATNIYNKTLEDYNTAVEHQSDCNINVEGLTKELEDVTVKEEQYKVKIDKLMEAIVFLKAKKTQEESNLSGLVHAGACPSCKQAISEEYLEGLKEELNTKITDIESDITLYKERLDKGNVAVKELNVQGLRKSLRVATLQLEQSKPNEMLLYQVKQDLEKSTLQVENLKQVVVGEKLTSNYELSKKDLQNKLDNAESKIKESLGDLETQYKLLVNSKPSQVENINQQISDRIEAMKADFGMKERSSRKTYELSVVNVQDKLKTAENRLEEGLTWLIKNKESETLKCEVVIEKVETSLKGLKENHESSLSNLQKHYDETLNKQFCKVVDLTELNKKHDKQQQDIEDYNDLLTLLSDKEGKADIVRNILPKLNKDVNTYLEAMGLFINLEIDSEFNMIMCSEDRKGQSLYSLSAGQKSKVDLSILLALRDLASSKESVSCNLLILDEILEPFSAEALQDIILMLQERYKDNNTVLITQRGDEVKDLFQHVKNYGLRGGFTVELKNED